MLCWPSHRIIFSLYALQIWCALAQTQPGDSTILGQSSQPFSNLQKVGCQVASLYQHPNASASYPIPAIDAKTTPGPDGKTNITLMESSTANWTFTNILGRSIDAYAPDNHTVLQQAMYLDTHLSFRNGPAILDAGLTGCSFFFSLPLSELGKKDDGGCANIFDQKCIDDFKKQANSAAFKASQNISSGVLAWDDSCKSIADAMSNLPPSCLKFKEKGSRSLGNGIHAYSPLDLQPPLSPKVYSCNGSRYPLEDGPLPSNLFLQSAAWPNTTDYKLYDQWVSTVTPILLTYFTNTSRPLVNSEPFSSSQLICSSPFNIQSGSRVAPAPKPSNAAENVVGQIGITQLVLGALAVNAVIFWML